MVHLYDLTRTRRPRPSVVCSKRIRRAALHRPDIYHIETISLVPCRQMDFQNVILTTIPHGVVAGRKGKTFLPRPCLYLRHRRRGVNVFFFFFFFQYVIPLGYRITRFLRIRSGAVSKTDSRGRRRTTVLQSLYEISVYTTIIYKI